MVPQYPSIESFFDRKRSPEKTMKPLSSRPLNDGFTEEEINAPLHPSMPTWQPRGEYGDMDIGRLVPGPFRVALMGRVVNFFDQPSNSRKPKSAKGSLKVIVKDDTGAITVKLWYADMVYNLRLGHLISIWTPHVSEEKPNALKLKRGGLVTSVFPERDDTCYVLLQENSDDGTLCKTPIGYEEGKRPEGSITLKNFAEGGSEIVDCKIMVCVKAIGARKKFTSKAGKPAEKVDVTIFDDTIEASLTLWGRMIESSSAWKPSHTILLITNPMFRGERRPTVTVGSETHIEIDPDILDAELLRKYAQGLLQTDHVNLPFPENLFDVQTVIESQVRIKFTLAEIDDFARAAPNETYIGYLSVIILELNITKLYHRNMLCCTECCGVPLFANATAANCQQCETEVALRINPRLVGALVDETGNIACGKLIWSNEAWEQLLGRTPEELLGSSLHLLQYLEHRLLFLRVTLLFGWNKEVGKSSIFQVMA